MVKKKTYISLKKMNEDLFQNSKGTFFFIGFACKELLCLYNSIYKEMCYLFKSEKYYKHNIISRVSYSQKWYTRATLSMQYNPSKIKNRPDRHVV